MKFPNLSERFDAEDIRKLREYNSLRLPKCPIKRFWKTSVKEQNPL